MIVSSRDNILKKLHATRKPFSDVLPITDRKHMVPINDLSPATLQGRFAREAEALGCEVTAFSDVRQAVEHVQQIITPDTSIQSWDPAFIPLPGLAETLASVGIKIAPGDTTVRIGLTGADAALAGTGSLVLAAGPGKPRQASLVPPVHIAVITSDQIIPDLDTWAAAQHTNDYQDFRSSSNVIVISGPSRTGDIANIAVRGVHGPGTLHIIIV
jgi:L-lactate dehydrogenase complex protein LldG